jgi:hypothetical protein
MASNHPPRTYCTTTRPVPALALAAPTKPDFPGLLVATPPAPASRPPSPVRLPVPTLASPQRRRPSLTLDYPSLPVPSHLGSTSRVVPKPSPTLRTDAPSRPITRHALATRLDSFRLRADAATRPARTERH